MASGNKELIANTRERIVSTDTNRMQKFRNADSAEFLRYLMDVLSATDDLDAGAITTEYGTLESPLRAEIVNGLLVRPAVGSLNLTIDAGMVWALSPDSAADDSNYKYVHDAGLLSGTLQFTAGSGSTRIDVLECQPQSTTVETATRDIYNPTTGTFAPTSVPKAQAGSMIYRIRLGTPGVGFPGTASGWLPLLVAVVPSSATTNDGMTFYDVRRMVNDRAFGMFHLQQSQPVVRKAQALIDVLSTGGKAKLTGFLEAEYNGHRIGGNMLRGTPGTDSAYVDLLDAANQEQGFSTPANGFAWLYLLFPFSLPRWARYTDALSGSCIPRSPRGIPLLSGIGPQHATGKPSSAVPIPTAWGFGSSGVSDGLCVAGVLFASSAAKDSVMGAGQQRFAVPPPSISANGGATTASQTYTVTENTHFPANAKTIFVRFNINFSVGNTIVAVMDPSADISDGAGNTPSARAQLGSKAITNVFGSTQVFGFEFLAEIPVPTKWPSTTPGSYTITFTTNVTFSAVTLSGTPTLTVVGWRF